MLQKLNERIQGIVAWVVILLIALTFALFGVDYYMQTHHTNGGVEVTVNNQPITVEALELGFRRTRQQRDPAQVNAAVEKQLKHQILNEMITNAATMQAARRYGFEVSLKLANAAILGIPQFQEEGRFSPLRYQQALSSAFFTPETFQKEVQQGMMLNQQRFALIGTAFALPNEITQFVKLYMQTRDYAYLTIPFALFLKDEMINDEEIKSYYQQHKKKFFAPEQVSVEYARLSMADIKSKITISDNEIKRYYEENQSNFMTPARWKVAHILFAFPAEATEQEKNAITQKMEETYQLLQRKPELFSEKVQTVSDDKISARQEGLLPWITAGQPQMDKALANLTQPGQISAPVKTQHGLELFKLVEYQPAAVKPLDKVAGDIKEQLIAEQAQQNYSQALEQMSDLSYQTPDSLLPVTQTIKLPLEQTKPFSRQGGEEALTKNKQVIQQAFNHDVLILGNNSEPIQVDNETVIVLRVNQHIARKEKSLEEVYEAIKSQLSQEKAQLKASELSRQLVAVFQNQDVREKLIQEHHLQWQEVKLASRENDKAPEDVHKLAFAIAKAGDASASALANGDYVIVHLKNITDGALKTLDKEQIASITQQLEASYGAVDYELYVNSIMKKANISRN